MVGASSGAEGPEGRPLEGMMVTGPGQACVTATYPKGLHGLAITRRELDTWLLNAAIAAGAQFESGVAVRDPALKAQPIVAR